MGRDEFWASSPREVWRTLEAFDERQRIERRLMITGAWLAARYARLKRLPKLQAELDAIEPPKVEAPKTIEQQRTMVLAFAQHFGLKVLPFGKPFRMVQTDVPIRGQRAGRDRQKAPRIGRRGAA